MRELHIYKGMLAVATLAVAAGSGILGMEEPALSDSVLFDFQKEADTGSWMIVNDGVMGGLSQSRMTRSDEGTAVFEGYVSLDNNGGFASVRTQPSRMPTEGSSGIAVRVLGDGREYQLRIRTDEGFDGVAYRSSFATRAGEWMTIEVPFEKFVPSFRGRVLSGVPPIDPAGIRQIGLLIADKKEGEFRLEVDWIKTLESATALPSGI